MTSAKMIKRGSRVKINGDSYKISMEKTISNMLNILPKDHPYIQDLRISLSRILDRAISGDIATVTKITDPNSSNMYLNLEFGDGFVCGVEGNLVNEI